MTPTGDRRDGSSWVVLELTRQGEIRVEDGNFEAGLRDFLDLEEDHPVFIPAKSYLRDGTRVTVHLMAGYAFVATGLPEHDYFALEHDCPYVRQVLSSTSTSGIPVLQVIDAAKVEGMRQQLQAAVSQDVDDGMWVKITQGRYRGLTGEVVGMEDNEAFVFIELRSYQVIKTLPKVFLEPTDKETDP
jgi:hypothetical protein